MNSITEPFLLSNEGIYRDIPNAVYHGDRSAVSSSGLKLMLQSPAHFVARQTAPSESTAALVFGTALHAALLEPNKYRDEYVAKPQIDRRSKAGKALAATLDAALADKIQLDGHTLTEIDAMVASAKRRPLVAQMLEQGEAEVTYVWRDRETGILCKCRPDWLKTTAIVDLKSCLDGSNDGFSRACATYHYHVSAAFYVEGVRALTGQSLPFHFIAAEKGAPYAVAVYTASDAFLRLGARLVRQALNQFRECRERDTWPSYQPHGQSEAVDLPMWARKMG